MVDSAAIEAEVVETEGGDVAEEDQGDEAVAVVEQVAIEGRSKRIKRNENTPSSMNTAQGTLAVVPCCASHAPIAREHLPSQSKNGRVELCCALRFDSVHIGRVFHEAVRYRRAQQIYRYHLCLIFFWWRE